MKINTAKQKMLSGKPALGFAAKLGSPVAAEFLSHCGADFVSLDTQHGSWGDDSMIAGVTSICAGAATPMARVLNNQYHLVARLLDAGVPVLSMHSPYETVAKFDCYMTYKAVKAAYEG